MVKNATLAILAAAGAGAVVVYAASVATGAIGRPSFSVVCTDSVTSQPIPGALVTFGISQVVTDTNGKAVVPIVSAIGVLTVQKQGYATYINQNLIPANGQMIPVQLVQASGVPLNQSLVFQAPMNATTAGVTVNYRNVSATSFDTIVYVTVKNSVGQTMAIGTSSVQTVPAGATVAFTIAFGIPFGTWEFDIFCVTPTGTATSLTTVLIAKV